MQIPLLWALASGLAAIFVMSVLDWAPLESLECASDVKPDQHLKSDRHFLYYLVLGVVSCISCPDPRNGMHPDQGTNSEFAPRDLGRLFLLLHIIH